MDEIERLEGLMERLRARVFPSPAEDQRLREVASEAATAIESLIARLKAAEALSLSGERDAIVEECADALHRRLPYPTEACAIVRSLKTKGGR